MLSDINIWEKSIREKTKFHTDSQPPTVPAAGHEYLEISIEKLTSQMRIGRSQQCLEPNCCSPATLRGITLVLVK